MSVKRIVLSIADRSGSVIDRGGWSRKLYRGGGSGGEGLRISPAGFVRGRRDREGWGNGIELTVYYQVPVGFRRSEGDM